MVQLRIGKDDNSTGGSAVEEECIIVGGKVKKQGHGGWMPKCARLAQAYVSREWKTCTQLIKEFKNGSSTFAAMVK